ncbi:Flocculation suppression protein [Sporothrix epigloea]|uniref:Flocculation suppression protein n=1 Tax=Sporothrix epigloea TaxID=1892477 RepID=A0ABP0DKC0_9PEZI
MTPTIQTSAPSPDDPMEITTPTKGSPPPLHPGQHQFQQKEGASPRRDTNSSSSSYSTAAANGLGNDSDPSFGRGGSISPPESSEPTPTKPESNASLSASSALGPGAGATIPTAAAPAVHQTKIVQTAFIHKLYNMLEDPNIQQLISWSPSAESFVMSPSPEFSKVLAQYFKHTNVSSFVRQLNMYGFHKVSDVFANGSESTMLWEFKHGNNNFRRGDLVGLREIKRRASRHSLVHREYNPQRPPPMSQPGASAELPSMPDVADTRLPGLDHTLYNIEARLHRNEEAMHHMHVKHQAMLDAISRLLHLDQDMYRIINHLLPAGDIHLNREVAVLQAEIQRQAEVIRGLEDSSELPYASSRPYFGNHENALVSPRQMPIDDPRRATLGVPHQRPPISHRPPVPSNLSISTRRPYGSIGGTSQSSSSPSSVRPQHPPPPPPALQHPLVNVEPSPNMARRHTSADIRAQGWQSSSAQYPPTAGPPLPPAYPPSPSRAVLHEDQRIHESFSAYSLQSASQPRSRPETPPPILPPFANANGNGQGSGPDLGNWSWASANRSSNSLNVNDSSAPPTRRGSMAHILNPTDTAERDDEDGSSREDERKRKRVMK